ncbi:MAG: sulfate transporter [Deltaproteobacteria bacterium]|nr:sulfate transporter [Deltaproteobacteria bacterium]
MRFGLTEVSGALGDLGTFVPLVAALIAFCGLDGGTVLLFAGLFNVATGLMFNQPLPVQPMKAIAAVAIGEGLARTEIAAAGFAAGAIVLFVGVSGLVDLVKRLTPHAVVRGIQLGVGLKLAAKGLTMILSLGWWGTNSRLIGIAGALLVLLSWRRQRFPTALVLFVCGLALVVAGAATLGAVSWGWGGIETLWPNLSQWKSGILRGALPQIPLTLLNSVIAVCALSEDYFPGRGIAPRTMAISVGLMNTVSCMFGAMPVCHGSGGLAGQYRFGARTGGSVVMLGIAKIALALALGSAAGPLMQAFPAALLGVMLVSSGMELTLPARDCAQREAFFVAAATAGGILAVNTWVGFIVGLAAGIALLRKDPKQQE